MPKVSFRTDACKGCGLCITSCPQKILVLSTEKINAKGHHPAENIDMDKCTGCAFCAIMCPDCVITVER